MSSEEIRIARSIAFGHAAAGMFAVSIIVVGVSVHSVIYTDCFSQILSPSGIQLFMVTYGFTVFLETPAPKRKGRLPYMIITCILFVLPTIGTLVLYNRYFNIWWDMKGPLEYFPRQATQMEWANHVNNTLCCITFLLADGLMVYRCYMIWADRLWVVIFPGLLQAASTGEGDGRSTL